MKNHGSKGIFVLILMSAVFVASPTFARDDIGAYPLSTALNSADAKAKLGNSIKFAFGSTSVGAVKKNHGEFRSNKKTNAFGKSDEAACNRAFLSAMISLRDRAVLEGGNAVINIRSNYKNNTTSSNDSFQCGAGGIMAGVALIGDVVTVN
jgi:uncharacterized protein YbjQ (UPF0145 family)